MYVQQQKRIMIFVDWFLPGYKAGGQIQSCANLADALKGEREIYVVTTDRDLGDKEAYKGIITDQWNQIDKQLFVLYISPHHLGYKTIRNTIRQIRPHCIYFNSMFSIHFTIMALAACAYRKDFVKLVLAPRGMLHEGALQFKRLKKQFFLKVFRTLRVQKKVLFHATDEQEINDIRKVFGKNAVISYVKDFPSSKQPPLQPLIKEVGSLNCLFISRVSPKKNLLFLLQILKQVKATISLSVVGPIETPAYWTQCLQLIEELPQNIKVTYLGTIPNPELPDIYAQHHLLTLPTFGENFGHVVFESLLNGRPVLISDQTPWRCLHNEQIGWDLPLSDPQKFIDALEEAANWSQEQFDTYSKASWNFAYKYNSTADLKTSYLELFN